MVTLAPSPRIEADRVVRQLPFAPVEALRRLAKYLAVPGWRRMNVKELVRALTEALY